MKRYLVLSMLMIAGIAHAQFTITSFSPTNKSTNVPLIDTLVITFSAPLDTNTRFGPDQGVITNVDTGGRGYYSADLKTLYVPVTLSPNTVYFGMFYWAKSQGGAILQTPYITYFTTGSTFPADSVKGTVSQGSTGVSAAGAIAVLSSTPISQNNPTFVAGAFADGTGKFIIPYVKNGTYYPVAAKDVNGDGKIDPQNGSDVVGFSDSIVVNNANVSGVNITFVKLLPLVLSDAVHIADSLAALLPANKTLRSVQSWNIDSAGRANGWQFTYVTNGSYSGYQIEVDAIKRSSQPQDSSQVSWVSQRRAFSADSAASSRVFLTNVEAAGGYTFRTQVPPAGTSFSAQTDLGDLSYSNYGQMITDASKSYWGAQYLFSTDPQNPGYTMVKSMLFLGNFSTGAVIKISTDVQKMTEPAGPVEFGLLPNYPNPFNPSTTISFRINMQDVVSLRVFDVLGREVATLVHGTFKPGRYSVQWNANNLPSGVYYCRLESSGQTSTTKLMLLK